MTYEEAVQVIQSREFELILLDVSLPGKDGFELCAYLQSHPKTKNVPVIFLTGMGEVTSKVTAFSLGAEDYITKPFNLLEFRARIDARLKKARAHSAGDEAPIRGEIELNLASQRALRIEGEKRVDLGLTPMEFKILHYLVRNEGRVLSRDQILNTVWGQNIHVFDRTVDTHISTLRKKLGPKASLIRSVPGSGYGFFLPEKAA